MPIKSHTLPARFPLARHTRPATLGMLLKASSIWRERQDLSDLDDHLLKDIGVSRTEAKKETKRPVWDAPNRWLR